MNHDLCFRVICGEWIAGEELAALTGIERGPELAKFALRQLGFSEAFISQMWG